MKKYKVEVFDQNNNKYKFNLYHPIEEEIIETNHIKKYIKNKCYGIYGKFYNINKYDKSIFIVNNTLNKKEWIRITKI